MAGHSKWANIRHKKGAADAKRGKIFSKIAKEMKPYELKYAGWINFFPNRMPL